MTGPLRDIDAAAEWLGVKRSWLRDAVTARRVPFTTVGRHVRFSDEHLAAIVAAGEQVPVTAPVSLTARRVRARGRRAAA